MTSKTYADLTVETDVLDDDLLASYRGAGGPLKSITASLLRDYVQATPGAVPVLTKSANYTVLAADIGSQINCSGTFTLSLTAAATLGAGFSFGIKNTGTGVITIDPNGSELIDGRSTICVYPNEGFTVLCTSTAFNTVGRDSRVRLQPLYTVGVAAASVEFTQGWNDAEFSEFAVNFWLLTGAGGNSLLSIGGGSYSSSGHDYAGTFVSGATQQFPHGASGASILVAESAGAAPTQPYGGQITLTPYSASSAVSVRFGSSPGYTGNDQSFVGGGNAVLAGALDRIKFTCTSGNVAANSTFDIWGQR